MLRALAVLVGALLICACDASLLLAADVATDGWPSTGPFYRGTGFYLSPWKVFGVWLLFLCWVRTTDWISQDSQKLELRWGLWNGIAFFTFFLGLLLFWAIPVFIVGFILLLITWVAPLATYIVYRNKQVTSAYDKILSAKHTRRWFARKMNSFGIKMAGADIDPRDAGPAIKLTPMGGATERDDKANLLSARQAPGWTPARELLDDAIKQRATHVMLDFTPTSVGLRYQIDGVWHDRSSIERLAGDPILEIFKALAALRPADRRSRQSGKFGVEAEKDKYTCKITSQGTQTGERAVLQFEAKKPPFKTYEDLGMREKMQEQLEELLSKQGLFIFSSLPGGGLTTTMDEVLSHTDRYMRNFVELVDEDKPTRDIENVHQTTFSAASGESTALALPRLIRTYPDVIVVRDVADQETLSILCEQARDENRLVLTSVRAKEAVEALLRMLMLKVPAAEFAPAVIGVLNVRLIRKLCEKCKEAYPPPPEVLKQLGLPAGRIEALYRPPTQPIDPKRPDVVCDACQGVAYVGRTAIFELLVVDDAIRQVLTTAPKLENLRAVARKAKQRSLQEEGVLLVARGVTSIPELLRVLKQ